MQKQHAHSLYLKMKDDILHHRLPVGEPLKQVELSTRYDVSRIPIRDTLQKLKAEGWLTQTGKRGVMVAPLSATEAEDLYQMRLRLEPLLLQYSIANLSHKILGEAQDILEQIDSETDLSIEQHGELNWQFHACLYRQAMRPTLFNTVSALHQQCGRYIGYHTLTLKYQIASQSEHYQLLEAIKHQDVQKAVVVLEQHIRIAGEQLVEHLR